MPASHGRTRKSSRSKKPRAPKFHGWRTTDEQEVERRRWRGRTQVFGFERLEPDLEYFGNFEVEASSAGSYTVEIRDLKELVNSCTCRDFETSGLGTCKHIEGVLHLLAASGKRRFNEAAKSGSPRIEVHIADDPEPRIAIRLPANAVPAGLAQEVGDLAETLGAEARPELLDRLRALAAKNPGFLRVSCLLGQWVERREREIAREERRAAVLADLESGSLKLDFLKYPLFSYQTDGVLHLALGERAMLADDMGLGKTVQAIGATELLARVAEVERVLVVCPASLKAEWAEQIAGATDRRFQLVYGLVPRRLEQYRSPEFFTIANYEQIRSDIDHIGRMLKPDLVILDEAQRIKNWRTQTAESVKRLQSRYAFVLTGTPLENRIDEVYSIAQYLDPGLLGPLFRFNRRYYVLDDRGRPSSLQNLDELHERVGKVMLRRRKAEIEHDLPDRTVRNYFLPMTRVQQERYDDYEYIVAVLAQIAKTRPLSEKEFHRLQVALACMRMLCDTAYILDGNERDCPKLDELEHVLEDLLSDPSSKVIIFSEWVRMLELVGERLAESEIEFALHTGSVPQQKRRQEILRFKEDPDCRVFLSSESGGTGLNLQAANAVVNLDLPWNPARLEQRIARAWRKHQKRTVNVVNLVAEDTIEHRILYLLEEKQKLSDAVLDGTSKDGTMDLPSGRNAFLERLEELLEPVELSEPESAPPDPVAASLAALKEAHGEALFVVELRKDRSGGQSLLVVLQAVDGMDVEADPGAECALAVSTVDRQSYETMLRMEQSGLLDFSGDRIDILYRQTLEDRAAEEARRNREKAVALLEDANRRQKMATLLSGGGFEMEAGQQAAPIASLAIRAIAIDAGIDVGEEPDGDFAYPEVCGRLVEAGAMPEEMEAKAYRLCSGTSAELVGREQSAERNGAVDLAMAGTGMLLGEAERILEHAQARISG